MNKTDAQRLVQETLQAPFNKERFVWLVKNILNRIEEDTFVYKGRYIFDDFADSIQLVERIGKYQDSDKKLIDILIVHLQKDTSLERARTKQRNYVAKYLKSRGGVSKDAALVAFVAPNENDWRFSLVKMEYRFNEKGRVEEEFTPARRYSFLVGKNENSHTAQSRLLPVLLDDETNLTLAALEDVFSVEKVTKEFFEKYRDLFLRLKEALDDVVGKDTKVKDDFRNKNVDTADFAKKLLGQIVFLYFLQKKGWFGVKRGEEWGSGSKHFLRELFAKKHGNYKNFFNNILEPLFYEALRLERSGDYYSRFDCRIPFLNGGLFDPLDDYDWVETDILLSDELFSNDCKTKEGDIGNGILDIFDRYNFTVKEDEPLDKEVAVDPEMLGKVFENLLAVKDKKSKGTYYTPREIVHYMCQESLVNYLAAELEDKANKKDLETLIKYGESAIEHDSRVASEGRETKTYSFKLPESVRKYAKLIDEKLASIRVCDPAVGSGAFPVGMMNEIVKTRNALTPHIDTGGKRTPCQFKREAIQNCLYGVDIDPGAIEITKLRLWLSLVVDEEERNNIQPLPNLDYKIVQGNSLLSAEKNVFNLGLFDEFEKLKLLYFNETSASKKLKYRKQIDKLISQITNGHKDFSFEVYFSEVFHENGGFDVVIANPPYISYGLRGGQKMQEGEKRYLRSTFPNSAEYKISLYAIFMDKGLQITKPNGGIEAYIVPDSFLLGRYFSKIRSLILKTSEIINILLLPFSVFKATVGFSVVYLIQRKQEVKPNHQLTARFTTSTEDVGSGRLKFFSYPQNYFNNQKYERFRLFFDKKVMALISKIEKGSVELKTVARFSSGLIGKASQKDIISERQKSDKWKSGIISGSEIKRYAVIPDGFYILYEKQRIKSGYGNVDYFNNKIFMRQTGDSLVCAFDDKGLLALNNIHVGNKISNSVDLKFVTALLNSRTLNFYYRTISLETGRVMAQTDIETIEALPIKSVSLQKQQSVTSLVDKILTKQTKVREYENQIDQLVYKLYDLTAEEIKIVENTQ